MPRLRQRAGDRRKTVSKLETNSPQFLPESERNFSSGIGVGIGEGIGEKQKPSNAAKPVASDGRIKAFTDAFAKYWTFKNPSTPFTPSNSDFGQLKRFLRDNDRFETDRFITCLRHRARSEVVHTQPLRKILMDITEYEAGPINRRNGNGKQQTYADKNQQSVIDAVRASIASDSGLDQDRVRQVGNHVRPADDERTIDAVRRRTPELQAVSVADSVQSIKAGT